MENKITTEKVPDFLIIGAQKSGTTSMHEYLKTHPEIYMSSPIKEPGLFLPFDHMQKYFSKFFNLNLNSREQLIQKCVLSEYHGERIFGESSTYYTITDMSRSFDIPKKIFEANPKMKLIYCIRNPLSRMVSHYLHCIKRGYTKSPLNKELSVKRDYLLT
ncbi:MAG: sulfotransferase domain-containing protein, partial [Nanoarchaeota archaeon]|nr:sulfotransferase domain-containing protein [Nanoarchaeota archaeon]